MSEMKAPYCLSEPELFVDNQAKQRSGHMGHALVEYQPGCLLDFYSNCDYYRVEGHSGYGWMEYRRSTDYGKTFGAPEVLPYTVEMYKQNEHTALCEKAVCAPNGDIVLFFQITDAKRPISCEPWSAPTCVSSSDGGHTWSDGRSIGADPGRIYDALADESRIYVLELSNDASVTFVGNKPEHVYKLYCSDDSGKSFYEAAVLPINAMNKGYGALQFAENGDLYAYAYAADDECHMTVCVSHDRGMHWDEPQLSYVAKMIRNPQINRIGDLWILHGRNGGDGDGLVLYYSSDGIHWDEGVMVAKRPGPGTGYYSNNIVLKNPDREGEYRLLIQYSHVYDLNRVNIMHVWLTPERA